MSTFYLPRTMMERFRDGMVIPAQPLALDAARRLDEPHQRALTRYYVASGAGGLAVGVHSTQFAIRDPGIGLFRPVLELAAETACDWANRISAPDPLLIAGVCGPTDQAISEAETARGLGYHAILLSLAAIKEASIEEKVQHCRRVAEIMPVIGFYLQPSVGGAPLPYAFWRRFAEIPNVIGIKIAPFNRYQTLDVVRAVAESGRADEVVLYTGNDDNIVCDLVTPYRITTSEGARTLRMAGGLLGHWAVWTRTAVMLLEEIKTLRKAGLPTPLDLLARGIEITDSNAAFFDAANRFAGCIPGIHEVLRRQGLMRGTWCLDPSEVLSTGQALEIDRVLMAYPHLTDDDFVHENLDTWLDA